MDWIVARRAGPGGPHPEVIFPVSAVVKIDPHTDDAVTVQLVHGAVRIDPESWRVSKDLSADIWKLKGSRKLKCADRSSSV